MALQFTKTLQVKRDNNSNVFVSALTATQASGPAADADLAAQVQAKVVAAQGSADELNAILAGL